MYFTLELDGRRKVVQARKTVSIGQVTALAFGPTMKDARVVIATKSRDVAIGARCEVWPLLKNGSGKSPEASPLPMINGPVID